MDRVLALQSLPEAYFGEGDEFDRCGVCDNCTDPPELRHEAPINRESLETAVRSPAATD